MTTLQAEGLEAVRGERTLFAGLGFDLQRGEVAIVAGRNGSGKTTLLRILSGLRRPDAGSVRYGGETIEDLDGDYRAQVAYVGHLHGIKRELTAIENLAVSGALHGSSRTGIAAVLDRVGLAGLADLPVQGYSAGQCRRLALARLLISGATLWLLDEPHAALDRQGIHMAQDLIVAHAAAGGMVVATAHHDLNLGATPVRRIDLAA